MTKIEELKKLHEKAKSSLLTAEMSHMNHIKAIKNDFKRVRNEIRAELFDGAQKLVDYVARKTKRADEKHYKAIAELNPLQQKATNMYNEAVELEETNFEL